MVAVTAEIVRDIYLGLFGRPPESEEVIQAQIASGQDLATMLHSAVSCDEFRWRQFRRDPGDLLYDGLNPGDEALLRKYLDPAPSHPDFLGTFIGTRQRTTLAAGLETRGGGVYREIPTVAGDIAAETVEYIGTIKAAEASTGSFVMAELGAGLGSWCTIGGHLARKLGRTPIRLYAVEASSERVEQKLKQNFADNGFNPDEHTIIAAAVGAKDGFALFPRIDVQHDFGASAIFSDELEEREGFDTVKTISLQTLLANETIVDLLHFDVQGAEADAIKASIEMLNQKVRYMVVGTHGRDIEFQVRQTLLGRKWILEHDQPARFDRTGGAENLMVDGTQVWRNPAL